MKVKNLTKNPNVYVSSIIIIINSLRISSIIIRINSLKISFEMWKNWIAYKIQILY